MTRSRFRLPSTSSDCSFGPRVDVARRHALRLSCAALVAPAIAACTRRSSPTDAHAGGTSPAPRAHVVVYSSADAHVARGIADAFERSSNIRVVLVGDTEATKTTGLAVRLESEAAGLAASGTRENETQTSGGANQHRTEGRGERERRGTADVWWSSEVFSTIRLSRAGVLAPLPADVLDPHLIRGSRSHWAGFALRSRVLAFSARAAEDASAVRGLADLAAPAWRSRVGIARGPFGTTRGHLAALAHINGMAALEAWLGSLKENRARVYDGNAAVVRAIAAGEIDAGLTDTDDVHAGNANAWNLSMSAPPLGLGPGGTSVVTGTPTGPMVIPNTAALVRGGPNPDAAARFLTYLLSPEAEREIGRLSPGHESVRPQGDPGSGAHAPGPASERLDFEAVEAAIPDAMNAWTRVMG